MVAGKKKRGATSLSHNEIKPDWGFAININIPQLKKLHFMYIRPARNGTIKGMFLITTNLLCH